MNKIPNCLLISLLIILISYSSSNNLEASVKAAKNFSDARKSFLLYNPPDINKSISYYNETLKNNPNDANSYAGLAESYSLLGIYKKEIKEDYENEFNLAYSNILKALSIDKENINTLRALAYFYLHLSRESEALKVANLILEKKPDDIETIYISWAAEGKKIEDPRILTVLEKKPEIIIAHVDLAKSYFFRKRRYTRAADQIKEAIKINDSPYLRTLLGTIYRTQKSISNSLIEYKRALELEQNFAPAVMNQGISLYYKRNTNKSLEKLQRAISLNPKYPDSYYYLASNYERKGHTDLALANYKQFTEMASDQLRYSALVKKANENIVKIRNN